MKKLLLFGGTFNPVHNGHVLLLKNAIKEIAPDTVIVMPTGVPPHKQSNNTKPELKLKMCECFLPLHSNIIIDNTEVTQKEKSYTINTILYLKNKYPQYEIYLSMGSDMFLMFEEWKEYEQILKYSVLTVHCREFDDIKLIENYSEKLKEKGANIIIIKANIIEVSSTQIRNLIKEGKSIGSYVPKLVEDIIVQNKLYIN